MSAVTRKFSLYQKRFILLRFLQNIGRPIYFFVAFSSLFIAIYIHKIRQKQHFHKVKYLISSLIKTFSFLIIFILSLFKKFFSVLYIPFLFIAKIVKVFFTSHLRLWKWLAVTSITLAILSAGSFFVYDYLFKDLPSPLNIATHKNILTTKIYDRRGEELYSIYKDENRTLVKLNDIPQNMIHATIAIEDADFFTHPGFSLKGILRALNKNASGGQIQGGSTITQQLVKNTLLTSEKKLKRKIREALLAIAVDALYSKEYILEMYFNQIPYGGSTYGIEEAAQRYFGKHASELNLAESALLAGIPAAPTTYSPFGSHPELARARQREVLRRMVEEQFITPEEAIDAMQEELSLNADTTNIQAPHFVMYVRSLLSDLYGEDTISQSGLEVYTTLDLKAQQEAQTIVTEEIKKLGNYHITNGAALVTNPNTGEILAMIGSTDYFDVEHDGQVNLTTSLRQPGSSIKPITYALALENGFTPSTKVLDAPITFPNPGSKPYSPVNYDGKYHGNVTLRQALANSYNIPAVKVLSTLGVQKMIDKAELMGIDTWKDRSRFGLSLTLGGGEVMMTDMAEVYGTFANTGYRVNLNPILLIKDAEGNILYQNDCIQETDHCQKVPALDPRVAYQMSDILSDNTARATAFGLNSVLHIPDQQVAVKTGTTNSLRDNWTIGYTSDRVVVVWVGNNDNTPMSYVASGITGASPIWNAIIRTQLNPESPHVFTYPGTLKKIAICQITGTLPCAQCPAVKEEYFIPGTEPTKSCTAESFVKKGTE